MSPSFNVWFLFLVRLITILKCRWASLMVISMLVFWELPTKCFFPICLPPAKQRAADRTLPQQYPAGSCLGHNVHGVRQDYWTPVSLSCDKFSKPRSNSRLPMCWAEQVFLPIQRGKRNPLDDHPSGGACILTTSTNLTEQNCIVSHCVL